MSSSNVLWNVCSAVPYENFRSLLLPSPEKVPSYREIRKALLVGGYPGLVSRPRRDFVSSHRSYIQTYLERDVRTLRQVGDLTQFQNFLRALAARSAQLLSLADIGRDLGVALNTVKAWLSVLEASFQVVVVRPYFANIGKRLVKTPKVYFTDTGTLCNLVGLRDPGHAASGPMAGPHSGDGCPRGNPPHPDATGRRRSNSLLANIDRHGSQLFGRERSTTHSHRSETLDLLSTQAATTRPSATTKNAADGIFSQVFWAVSSLAGSSKGFPSDSHGPLPHLCVIATLVVLFPLRGSKRIELVDRSELIVQCV